MSTRRADSPARIDDTPGPLDLRGRRGDSFSHLVEIIDVTTDETGGETESPRDLTGVTIRAQIRETEDGPLAASFRIDPVDLSAGRFYLRLDAITVGGVWDLELAGVPGVDVVTETVLAGSFRVDRDVTR